MEKKDVWTISSLLNWTVNYFKSKNIESARLDAEVLLSHILGQERIYLYVHFDEPMEKAELSKFREYVKKRAQHMPVAYIIGEKARLRRIRSFRVPIRKFSWKMF